MQKKHILLVSEGHRPPRVTQQRLTKVQETARQCQGHWIEGVEGSLLSMTWMATGSGGIGAGRAGRRDLRRGKGHSEQSSITEEENTHRARLSRPTA